MKAQSTREPTWLLTSAFMHLAVTSMGKPPRRVCHPLSLLLLLGSVAAIGVFFTEFLQLPGEDLQSAGGSATTY